MEPADQMVSPKRLCSITTAAGWVNALEAQPTPVQAPLLHEMPRNRSVFGRGLDDLAGPRARTCALHVGLTSSDVCRMMLQLRILVVSMTALAFRFSSTSVGVDNRRMPVAGQLQIIEQLDDTTFRKFATQSAQQQQQHSHPMITCSDRYSNNISNNLNLGCTLRHQTSKAVESTAERATIRPTFPD
ncbi:uncharacterized protein LOC120424221 [Culex pipiens pallens]|uniref:uncharacterized protein LOC120424221 n=1 Tax=Culex pipiens pallens TaxID=42434 RepID=UPI00195432A8|nr:uncharacterized protein LOC120424221 [Culex pipiens pallens]